MESIDEFKSSNTKFNNDETFMQRAIKAAVSSMKRGDVPFGAVVVQGDKIIAVSGNGELSRQDVTLSIITMRHTCSERLRPLFLL